MNGPREEGPVGPELLGRLLDAEGPALALYAAQWTDAADDCVQEALVELAGQTIVPANLRAWLYRVVKNRAINAARGARRRRERESRVMAERFATHAARIDRLDAIDVAEALEQLEPHEREIVVMRIWGSLTYEEIAIAMEMSTSSVHRQYQQALEKLRHRLESPCEKNTDPHSRRN